MSDSRKQLIEKVAATISNDLSDKLDVLDREVTRRQSVVVELEKLEHEARTTLEKIYADIAEAGKTLKAAEAEADNTKTMAHGHADSLRAETRAVAQEMIAKAGKEADRIRKDAEKASDAAAADLIAKKRELKAVQSSVDAARNELAAMRHQARKFADG